MLNHPSNLVLRHVYAPQYPIRSFMALKEVASDIQQFLRLDVLCLVYVDEWAGHVINFNLNHAREHKVLAMLCAAYDYNLKVEKLV